MHLRKRLGALTAAALAASAFGLSVVADPVEAAPPAPVILNNNGQNSAFAQWAETQQLPKNEGRTFHATFLVQHAAGRTIPNVRFDADYNGTDNTGGNGTGGNVAPTISQTFVAANGDGTETSRVTVAFGVNDPGGFSCPFIGGATRSRDRTIRMKVVDSTNEVSATVSTTVRFVETGNCNARADFPFVKAAGLSQSPANGQVATGQSISYTFQCDDPDSHVVFTSDDECQTADVRWRRLSDGETGSITSLTMGDNTLRTVNTSFDAPGYYVVEAQLRNENGDLPNAGGPTSGWWRLGNALVNGSASTLSGSLSFNGLQPSSPPSVNPGDPVSVVATAADSDGSVQAIEWNTDAHANGSFEGFVYEVPSGGTNQDIVHGPLTLGQRTRSVSTATPGLKTVQARLTDRGALDMADSQRRQATIQGQYRVNALPIANAGATSTNEDTPVTITLTGSDPDAQPDPIEYSIVSGPAPAAGTLGPLVGNQVTFTPTANYHGPASFTFRVRDGNDLTVGANGFSNTATVSITVNSVNDLPIVDSKSVTTDEDTPVGVTMTGNDIEDGTNLTYTVNPGGQATNGVATCSTGLCTYVPGVNFNGADSFVVRGTDSDGGFSTATVSVTVNPVNDAPVANAQSITVLEDASGHPLTLTASDVDNPTLTFSAPIDPPDHGVVLCLGADCAYTPDPDYNGPDSFTFEVSDGDLTDTATVTITVTAVNDAPTAIDVLDAVTDEDVPLPLTLGGTDPDGDPVTVSGATDPPSGTTSLDGPNLVTYQGDLNFHGVDTFDFTVEDGNGGSDTGTVVVTVNPVNDAPVVEDQAMTLDEDTPTFFAIAAGDVDGDVLTWSVLDGPDAGSLFGTGPDVVYVPNLHAHGSDEFTVQVDDGNGGIDTAVISITVAPVNDQPVANASTATVAEDGSIDIVLTGADLDGDDLTFTAPVVDVTNGAVSCSGPLCTYVPNADFHGGDLFTFTVDDGNGAEDTASVAITVTAVNDPPVALMAAVMTDEDTPVGITLSASDVDGDLLTFTTTAAAHGTVSGSGPNAVYTPNPNYNGPDEFSFTVADGNGGTDSADVTLLVNAVNDAPVALGGTVSTDEETEVTFQLGATDVEGDPLTFSIVSTTTDGVLDCDASGECTYTPDPDFVGADVLTYEVSDGTDTATGSVTIIVASANDAPEADDSSVTTDEDTAVDITLVATDLDDDELIYSVASAATNGTVVCSEDGSCVYTPAPNYHGPDAFTWSVTDGAATTTAVVSLTVAPVNDAPQALDVSAETDEDTPVDLLLLASDVESDAVTFTVETAPANGSVTIAGSVATYTPAADFGGTDVFTYRATDVHGASTIAQATIVVNELPLFETWIIPDAAVVRVKVSLFGGVVNGAVNVFPQMRATLRLGGDHGGPAGAGHTLAFTVGDVVVCTAVTDADGVAECAGSAAVASLLHLGYRVVFDGGPDHVGSAAKGPLIQILTLRL